MKYALLLATVLLLTGCAAERMASSRWPAGLSARAIDRVGQLKLNLRPWRAGPGVVITSRHYQIFTTVRNPIEQRLILLVLETEYAQFKKLVPEAAPKLPLYGFIFAHRRQWARFTARHLAGRAGAYLHADVAGYDDGAVFALFRTTVAEMLSVTAHEAWHQFSFVSLRDHLPAWLDEGLATQFETISWQRGQPHFISALNYPRWQALQRVCRRREFIAFPTFTRLEAGEVVAAGPVVTRAYYAEVWSLMLFLIDHYGRPKIATILHAACKGSLTAALLRTGLTAGQLHAETIHWNEIAGPLFFRKFITADPAKLFPEYKIFARQLVAAFPPSPELEAKTRLTPPPASSRGN